MDKKSRKIFYAVLMLATLIVAIVGATLAYFTYRTSSGDEAVKAHAASINVVYKDGEQVTAQADKLIPSSFEVVRNVYERNIANGTPQMSSNICLDDKNKQVCSAYRFSITSNIDVDTYALLNTEHNEFVYLVYALRDVDNNTWIQLDGSNYHLPLAGCSNINTKNEDDCYKMNGEEKTYNITPKAVNSIFGYNKDASLKKQIIGNKERTFDLVIFINENNKDQNVDQGKKYLGTITIEATNAIDKVIAGLN